MRWRSKKKVGMENFYAGSHHFHPIDLLCLDLSRELYMIHLEVEKMNVENLRWVEK